jgi:hypothetical protein
MQYITFKRRGREESVLLYSVVLQPSIDPPVPIVTKSPKVVTYLYSPSLWVIPLSKPKTMADKKIQNNS